jgi:hypothetical protein
MNGNLDGAEMLAYLRGEKDLFQERENFGRIRKKFQESEMVLGITGAQKRRMERFWQVASLLQKNSRISITEMSRKLKIPISTLFDTLKDVEKHFLFTIVLRKSEKGVPVKDTIGAEFAYQLSIDRSQEKKTPSAFNSE